MEETPERYHRHKALIETRARGSGESWAPVGGERTSQGEVNFNPPMRPVRFPPFVGGHHRVGTGRQSGMSVPATSALGGKPMCGK
jgi:hypothetical protein